MPQRKAEDLELHLRYRTGNVVQWGDSLWVVTSAGIDKVNLVAMWAENVSGTPSANWPTKRVYRCTGNTEPCEEGPEDYCVADPVLRGCLYDDIPDPKRNVKSLKVLAPCVNSFIMGRLEKLMLGLNRGEI